MVRVHLVWWCLHKHTRACPRRHTMYENNQEESEKYKNFGVVVLVLYFFSLYRIDAHTITAAKHRHFASVLTPNIIGTITDFCNIHFSLKKYLVLLKL